MGCLYCYGGYCLVFSCKKPDVQFPQSCCERCSFIVGIILFLLAIPELYGYIIFVDVFVDGSQEMCCGIMSKPGAKCVEEDFADQYPRIDKIEEDGLIYCYVNDVKCDWFTSDSGTNITIADCMDSSNDYNITDLCGTQILGTLSGRDVSPVFYGIITFIYGFFMSAYYIFDIWGCFRVPICKFSCIQGTVKAAEIGAWILFFALSYNFLEAPANKGYSYIIQSRKTEAQRYFEDECLNRNPAVTEYDLDVPDWLLGQAMDTIGAWGILLAVIDFGLFFLILCTCCCKSCRNGKILPSYESPHDQSTHDHTKRAIEGGDQVTTTTTTAPNNITVPTHMVSAPSNSFSPSPQTVVVQSPMTPVSPSIAPPVASSIASSQQIFAYPSLAKPGQPVNTYQQVNTVQYVDPYGNPVQPPPTTVQMVVVPSNVYQYQ